jgi:hypothetical protein
VTRLPLRLLLLASLAAAFLAATAGAASAAKPCGEQVIDDWYGSKTGQLSKTYPLHCYKDALKIVGRETDIDIYSNAREDILLAMQQALISDKKGSGGGGNRGNNTNGGNSTNGGSSGKGPTGGSPAPSSTDPTTADALPSFLGGPDAKHGGKAPASTQPVTIQPRARRVAYSSDPLPAASSASGFPLPAIVLAAVAGLLLALGAAAFLARRRQQRRRPSGLGA